ncbi:MAG: PAS domain S-box protein [Candidatus Lokiarchaeota archaeon]|nr:PAS domain S-box protein [Candidatus Lokiarchaeota archaeon]
MLFEPDEIKVTRKDGKIIWIRSQIFIFKLENEYVTQVIGQDISVKKETEINLKDSEEKYRDLFNNSPFGIFIFDENENLIDSNEQSKYYFSGFSTKGNYGQKFTDIILNYENSEELLEIIIERLKRVKLNESVDPIDLKLITKDGEKIWVHSQISKLKLKDKTILQLIVQDFTSRKQAEIALKETEIKLQTAVESLPFDFFILNNNREYTMQNATCKKNWGNIIGKHPIDIAPNKEILTKWEDNNNKAFSGEIIKEEFSIKVGKDEKIIFNIISPIIKNEIIKGILGVNIDITDQKIIEKKLRESEEKYRLITENVNDFITIINQDFKIEYINNQIHRDLLGYEYDDLVGKNAISMLHPDDVERAINITKEGWKKGSAVGELRVRDKKGKYIWVEIKGNIFLNGNGEKKGILIGRDITSRKKNQKRLEESENKYREAYRKANLYEDLFAHDVNNILQNIKSSVELSKIYINQPDKLNKIFEFFGIIQEQIIRGSNLVSNVIKLFKIEDEMSVPIEEIDLIIHLNQAIEFVRQTHQIKNLSIKTEIYEDNTIIRANSFLIDIFENILFNAVMYNDKNLIKIKIRIKKFEKDNRFFKIEFMDNGFGIYDNRKKIIFEENLEGKRKGGMGLGLSLVKKIIESYNGKIWVEDRIEGDSTKGSNFVLLIPELKNF